MIPNHRRRGSPEERFWRTVQKSDGCWLWQGCKTEFGYGVFGDRPGHTVLAHRWAFGLASLKPGEVVRHLCHVPACVNPAHLLAGSQKENVQDTIQAGRYRHGIVLGAAHGMSKLTVSDVLAIREARGRQVGCKELAKQFGCSESLISKVALGHIWSHVQ